MYSPGTHSCVRFTDDACHRAASCRVQVEIDVEGCDKGGTFLGSVTLPGPKPLNLGLTLARLGLAKTQPFFAAERVRGGQELLAAIQAAKQAHLKVRTEQRDVQG